MIMTPGLEFLRCILAEIALTKFSEGPRFIPGNTTLKEEEAVQ